MADTAKVKEEYRKASLEGKALLEKLFPKEDLKDQSGWLKSWEEFQRKNKLSVKLPFENAQNRIEEICNSMFMLNYIVEEANKINGKIWIPDYNNSNEVKYEPRFRPSGFALTDAGCDGWSAHTYAGSRLCYRQYNTMVATVEEYLSIYEKAYTY